MKSICFSFCILFVSACNFNQDLSIRGVDLHTHEEEGSTYVNLETIVSLGNLKLPNSTIPIQNLEQRKIGETTVQHLEDGTSRIAVSINYEEVNKMDTELGKTLPNGREVPSLLENNPSVVGIPVLQNSRIYISSHQKDDLYAGIALNIPAFDHILTRMSAPLNLLMPFPFSEEVMGTAGIYSGPQNGQNGLAIFVKKSQSIKNAPSLFPSIPNEIKKMNRITRLRVSYLFSKHAVLRIK